MRSVIKQADEAGIKNIVIQQFEIASAKIVSVNPGTDQYRAGD